MTFYEHFLPLLMGYLNTKFIGVRLAHLSGSDEKSIWEARHEWGSQRLLSMLDKLSGFYIKIAQVFATKYDLLPTQYIQKLSFVFENCKPASIAEVRKIIHEDLGKRVLELFENIDEKPIACATIAQVHLAKIRGMDGPVAMKIQHSTSEMLMNLDMDNMILVSKVMDALHLQLPFDHTSVLLEYQKQIPMEFDFCRERMMMESLRKTIQNNFRGVLVPSSLAFASSKRILTMTYMHGNSVAHILSRGVHLQIKRAVLISFSKSLLGVYGHQIFEAGVFHSDPHPGNLLINDSGTLTMLDFGQVKVLSLNVRVAFAQLIVSMSKNLPEAGDCLEPLGIKLDNCTRQLSSTIAYLLFDTRMDLAEARMTPFEAELPSEIRQLRLSKIPQEVFMLVRVVALMRGIFSSFDLDIHSRHIWAPYAERFLKKNRFVVSSKLLTTSVGRNVECQMEGLTSWLMSHELPHERKHLTPLALANIWNVESLAEIFSTNKANLRGKLLSHYSFTEQNLMNEYLLAENFRKEFDC